MPTRRLLLALGLGVCAIAVIGCGDDERPAATAPTASTGPTASTAPPPPRSTAELGDAFAPYLDEAGATIASFERYDDSLGAYVFPSPPWTPGEYVDALPGAVEAAIDLLEFDPTLDDVDVCADAPWLRQPQFGPPFVTGLRVRVFRDDLDGLPSDLSTPASVITAGEAGHLEVFLASGSPTARSSARRPAEKSGLRRSALLRSRHQRRNGVHRTGRPERVAAWVSCGDESVEGFW